MTMTTSEIIFCYICPSLGCILSAAMYSAVVPDLQKALRSGSLGSLNPVPWAIMTGNCLGWCAYGYYNRDPFMLASNFPGLVLSVWLNMGAAKLQYQERIKLLPYSTTVLEEDSNTTNIIHEAAGETTMEEGNELLDPVIKRDNLLFVPQETLLLQVLVVWIIILIIVGWTGAVHPRDQASVIGILVNINLIFFYGAPLQAIQTVLQTKSCASIHQPTMIMNSTNSIFWLLYGINRNDPYIYGPNTMGFLLGFAQMILCCCYGGSPPTEDRDAVDDDENDLEEPLLMDE